jgi:hypothetical protein
MDYVFLSLVVSTASGIVLASLAACRASKCTSVKFCGVQIDRDTKSELEIEEHAMDIGINTDENKQKNNIKINI